MCTYKQKRRLISGCYAAGVTPKVPYYKVIIRRRSHKQHEEEEHVYGNHHDEIGLHHQKDIFQEANISPVPKIRTKRIRHLIFHRKDAQHSASQMSPLSLNLFIQTREQCFQPMGQNMSWV